MSLLSLLALVFSVESVSSVISFGALFAFSLLNLSVLKHFVIDRRRTSPSDLIKYGPVPLIGFALTIFLWFSLSGGALLLGLSWMAAGIIYLAVLTHGFRQRPPSVEFEESAAMTLDVYTKLFDEDLNAVADALDAAVSRSGVAKMLPRA